ncbi:MAG: hypothetical protein ACKOBH_00530 [bacterium]
MRRRKVLVTAGAALGLFAFTGIAMAVPPQPPAPTPSVPLATGKYQTAKYVGVSKGTAKLKGAGSGNELGFVSGFTVPSGKQITKKKWTNVAMAFRTATGNGAYPGTGIPDPAVRAQVVFSSNLKWDFSKAATCAQSAIAGLSTDLAKEACPNSIIGGGVARVRVPGLFEVLGETQVVVTGFRGENDTAGNPTVILFSRNDALATGSALIGTVVNKPSWANGADYGKMLDVQIPLLTGGTTVLTQFEVTVGNGYKPGFIQAKCGKPTFKSSSRFYFSTKDQPGGGADQNPDSYLPASDSKKCG